MVCICQVGHRCYVLLKKVYNNTGGGCMEKGILFDLDGTLMETGDGIIAAFNAALGKNGFARRPPDDIRALIGMPLEEMFTKLAGDGNVEKMCDDYRSRYAQLSVKMSHSYPHTLETLERLDRYRLAIATTKTRFLAGQLCDVCGLTEFFDVIVGGDMVANTKPAPDMALLAAKLIGVDPKNCLMVGDTRFDIVMGKAAGMKTCGVTYGFGSKRELEDVRADYLIDDISRLPPEF